MAGRPTPGQRLVSARHAGAHELRREPSDLYGSGCSSHGHGPTQPNDRSFSHCHTCCAGWPNLDPHRAPADQRSCKPTLHALLRPGGVHDRHRYHHRVIWIVTPRSYERAERHTDVPPGIKGNGWNHLERTFCSQRRAMGEAEEWRTVYEFWFPPGLHEADLE